MPDLRKRVFSRMARLSFRFFDENASGSIINRLTGDVQLVRSFIDGALLPLGVVVMSLAISVAYMLRAHPLLTAACFAPAPVIWFLGWRFSRWALPTYRQGRALSDDMVLAMSEGVAGIQVTKVFGREEHEFERFHQRSRRVLEQQRAVTERVSRFGPTVAFAPASASVWQPAQPLDVNSALPSVPPPSAGAGGFAASSSQLANWASVCTTALARIVACPRPHSSAKTIGYSPSRFGVTR